MDGGALTVTFFDVSLTSTGVASGRVGERPITQVWKHGDENAPRRERLGKLFVAASEFIKLTKPDLVGIEAPLDPAVAARIGTSKDAAFGLIGGAIVVEMVAHLRGVPRVKLVNVQDVRAHFVGQRTFSKSIDPVTKRKLTSRETAKAATIHMCRLQGWHVEDDNAADAAAGWSWCCATLNPRLAAMTTPLFARAVA